MAGGMRAEEVLKIYMRHGWEIFPQPWTPLTRIGRAMRSAYQFARDLAAYRYNREPLERALWDRFEPGNRSGKLQLQAVQFEGIRSKVSCLNCPPAGAHSKCRSKFPHFFGSGDQPVSAIFCSVFVLGGLPRRFGGDGDVMGAFARTCSGMRSA